MERGTSGALGCFWKAGKGRLARRCHEEPLSKYLKKEEKQSCCQKWRVKKPWLTVDVAMQKNEKLMVTDSSLKNLLQPYRSQPISSLVCINQLFMIHMGFSFIVVCSCTFEVIVSWKTRCVFSAMQQLANCEGVCVTNSPTNLNDRWRNSMTSSNRSKNTYLVGYSSVFYFFKIPVYLSEKMKHVTYLSSLFGFS